MKIRRKKKAKKRKKKSLLKRFRNFLIFELILTCVTMPLILFYGPFDDVKKLIVGASWNTLSHQYIARLFLSDEKINELLKGDYAIDPTANGEEIKLLSFKNNNDHRIDVYNINGKDYNGKLMIIHDPERIKVGYSSNFPKSGETTSSISKRNMAVAAINAGGFLQGFTGTGGLPLGFIIHDGKVVYNKAGSEYLKQDTIAFTKNNMLIVGKHSISKLIDLGVEEGVSFGPPLIVNGQPTITKGDGGWGIAPRTAIGQKQTGEVLFLVIDGRTINSLGATLKNVQDILIKFGAVNAANLDGGSSTTMYLNEGIINKPSDKLGERTVPSIFMVMPEKEGAK